MLVDITRTLNSNIYTYPGDPKFSLKTICDINSAGFNVSQISMGSHCGTHVDAPKHFFGDLNGISDINLNTLCGKAFIADVSSLKNVDRNFLNGLKFSLFDIFILKTKNKDIFLTLNGAQELISKKIKAVGTECFDIEDEKINIINFEAQFNFFDYILDISEHQADFLKNDRSIILIKSKTIASRLVIQCIFPYHDLNISAFKDKLSSILYQYQYQIDIDIENNNKLKLIICFLGKNKR